ncbi:MAG: hypothetical protein R8G66_23300 [Cytophagales bacterium]|nr:hypothetical protein [Cytophagales bacterium]
MRLLRSLKISMVIWALFPTIAKSQDKSDPAIYQVIYQQAAFRSGTSLKKEDLIYPGDYIKNEHGLLVLFHLQNHSLHLSKNKNFLASDFQDTNEPIVSILEKNFIPCLFDSTKNRREHPKTISSTRPSFEFIYPHQPSEKITRDQELCVWWKTTNYFQPAGHYRIELKDIFENLIQEIAIDTTVLTLPIPEIPEPQNDFLVVEVYDDQNDFSERLGFDIETEKSSLSPCDSQRAPEFLFLAQMLEEHGNNKEALIFYDKSAQSSTHELYQLIYQFAQSRLANE